MSKTYQTAKIEDNGIKTAVWRVDCETLTNMVSARFWLCVFKSQGPPGLPVVLMAVQPNGGCQCYPADAVPLGVIAKIAYQNIEWTEHTVIF